MTLVHPSYSVVHPKLDYEVSADGSTMTYFAKSASRLRAILASMIALPFAAVGTLALLLALPAVLIFPNGASGTPYVLATIVVCGGALFLIAMFATWKKTTPIRFDEKSISFKGKTYLLEHVTSIGWRSSGGYVATGAAASAGAAAGYAVSGVVYIVYGSQEVTVITGLHPDNTERVYHDIVRFLAKFGYDYTS